MSELTTDRNAAGLNEAGENGQNKVYLVLSEEERAKGFVRPYRDSYIHKGKRPSFETRELIEEEKERYGSCGYVLYEKYPASEAPKVGRFWTAEQLKSGCGVKTTMSMAIAETYARDPKFYGSTFCCGCGRHIKLEEFVWDKDGLPVGS